MCRSHNATETQVYFALRDDSEELRIPKSPIEKQIEFWAQKFSRSGWQTDRFIEGMATTKASIARKSFMHAAYCPSPFNGQGITASLVGAFVLAGEINRNTQNLSGHLRTTKDVMTIYQRNSKRKPIAVAIWNTSNATRDFNSS
ncbi:hypothetical protein INT43_009159 [Umbelopsis isabellina]|uniref:Uncharacterized protein n=1 Tax=Mortierella isabellina TaxID=91625 RepID=A0A8H7PCU4_MORIS|nr:hypothetical protein INT43_009159 [Umbelopsis isabellina]